MRLKRIALVLALVCLHLIQGDIDVSEASPTQGNGIAWTDDTYFDSYSSRSGLSNSDFAWTSSLVWQLYYSWAPLSIPADGVMRLGFAAASSASDTVSFKISISTVDDTLGSFGPETTIGSRNITYSQGGFSEQQATTAVNIPAKRWFLIGIYNGPYYRSIKPLSLPRTAQINGVNYITVNPGVFYAPNTPVVTSGIPTLVGGSSSAFTVDFSYVQVMSIKFKVLGPPPLPALTTPDTPTISNITATSMKITGSSVDANAQSYTASLYQSNGTTFVESRTVTNSQITSGYSWTGLNPNTSYKVGLTATGDKTNYQDSALGGLASVSTPMGTTSLSFTLASPVATFNRVNVITATIGGGVPGKLTFYNNGKRIPGCIALLITGSSSTCNWKPSTIGASLVSATFTPNNNGYLGSNYMKSVSINIHSGKR